MLRHSVLNRVTQRGFTLLEVLIAIIITTFGLLGLAGLMSKMQVSETEGYQRSQALVLLSDMTERINAAMPRNSVDANAYAPGLAAPAGTGDTQPTDCTTVAFGATRDICEWSNALKGAAETSAASTGSAPVGAMIGARGCVELLTAPAVCTPATFRVSVVWQGLVPTAAPATTCGAGLYGPETERRAVAAQVRIGLPKCLL